MAAISGTAYYSLLQGVKCKHEALLETMGRHRALEA